MSFLRCVALVAGCSLSGLVTAGCLLDAVGDAPATSVGVGGGAATSSGGQPEKCGNGVVDGGENCDDGNDALGDGCESCRISAESSCDPAARGWTVEPDRALEVEGSLAGGRNELFNSTGLVCSRDGQLEARCDLGGREVYVPIRPSVLGVVRVELDTTGGAMAGDKGRLRIRRGCAAGLEGAHEDVVAAATVESKAVVEVWFDQVSTSIDSGLWIYVDSDSSVGSDVAQEATFRMTIALTACGEDLQSSLAACQSAASDTCLGCLDLSEGTAPGTSACGPNEPPLDGGGAVVSVWSTELGRCYTRHDEALPVSFYEARARCASHGADLAVLTAKVPDLIERDVVQTLLGSDPFGAKVGRMWLGFEDIERAGSFRWFDGLQLGASEFDGGTVPSDSEAMAPLCGMLDLETSLFAADRCAEPLAPVTSYLCERGPL
jgi:cysteine-rich repeat protein